jgi:hypothetical protein
MITDSDSECCAGTGRHTLERQASLEKSIQEQKQGLKKHSSKRLLVPKRYVTSIYSGSLQTLQT